jgi:exodeoxyribonuclease VII small subunit
MSKTKEGKQGFEESLTYLEKIVRQLESGDLPLERALELFEEGVVLARQCQSQLEEAERKVELLLRERGEIKTIPFEPANIEPAEGNNSSTPIRPSGDEDQGEKLNDAIPF